MTSGPFVATTHQQDTEWEPQRSLTRNDAVDAEARCLVAALQYAKVTRSSPCKRDRWAELPDAEKASRRSKRPALAIFIVSALPGGCIGDRSSPAIHGPMRSSLRALKDPSESSTTKRNDVQIAEER